MRDEGDMSVRIERLIDDVKKQIKGGLEDNIQQELAKLLGLLHYLRRPEYAHLVSVAEIAFSALLSEKPNLVLAQKMSARISYLVRPSINPVIAIVRGVRGGTPPTRVILGLGTLLYFTIPLLAVLIPRVLNQKTIVGVETDYLLMVAAAGSIGSIVSIMVRIQDFSGLRDVDPAVLFFTGFFKPVIGASFALFVFAALRAGLLPLTINEGTDRYFFMALSFVAGFSERFAKDIVKTTERQIGSSASEDK